MVRVKTQSSYLAKPSIDYKIEKNENNNTGIEKKSYVFKYDPLSLRHYVLATEICRRLNS